MRITVIVQKGLKTNLLMCYERLVRVIVQEVPKTSILVQEGLFNSYVK